MLRGNENPPGSEAVRLTEKQTSVTLPLRFWDISVNINQEDLCNSYTGIHLEHSRVLAQMCHQVVDCRLFKNQGFSAKMLWTKQISLYNPDERSWLVSITLNSSSALWLPRTPHAQIDQVSSTQPITYCFSGLRWTARSLGGSWSKLILPLFIRLYENLVYNLLMRQMWLRSSYWNSPEAWGIFAAGIADHFANG